MIRQNQLFYIIKIAVFFDLFNSHLRLDAGFFVFLVDTVGDARRLYISAGEFHTNQKYKRFLVCKFLAQFSFLYLI